MTVRLVPVRKKLAPGVTTFGARVRKTAGTRSDLRLVPVRKTAGTRSKFTFGARVKNKTKKQMAPGVTVRLVPVRKQLAPAVTVRLVPESEKKLAPGVTVRLVPVKKTGGTKSDSTHGAKKNSCPGIIFTTAGAPGKGLTQDRDIRVASIPPY